MLVKLGVTSWPDKNCLVVHFSEAKTGKGTDIQSVISLYILSCTEKCHLAENAYENEANIK